MDQESPSELQALKHTIEKASHDYRASLQAKKRLPREFVDGIVRGLGMAIGGTIIFGIVAYLLGQVVFDDAKRWVEEHTLNPAGFENRSDH